MRYLGAIAVTLASAALLTACSPRVTSLESEKTLSALSPEERRQYCEDQAHYLSTRITAEDHRKIACATAVSAIVGGAIDREKARAACDQSYQACLSVPTEPQQSSCESFASDAEGCAATVGDASKCAESRADALAALASKADDTCKDTTRRSGKEEPAQTEACVRVQTMCPKLFPEPGATPPPATMRRR